MTSEQEAAARDLKMDRDRLYLEEVITDLAAGTIRRLTPVKPDGSPDESRETLYLGQAQVLSAMGALPLQFELEASTLDEAIAGFAPAAEQAVRRMVEEIKELQRQQASQIVVPPSGAVPGAGGGGPPPGGRIQLT